MFTVYFMPLICYVGSNYIILVFESRYVMCFKDILFPCTNPQLMYSKNVPIICAEYISSNGYLSII